jgi:hypothetical protein
MYLELVILGGKREEETIRDLRKIVSDSKRRDRPRRFGKLGIQTASGSGGDSLMSPRAS